MTDNENNLREKKKRNFDSVLISGGRTKSYEDVFFFALEYH